MNQPPAQFDYFMLQTRSEGRADGFVVGGIVEHLGTGEKRSFQSADELARLLHYWHLEHTQERWIPNE